MRSFISVTKRKFMASVFALLTVGFFMAAPLSAAGVQDYKIEFLTDRIEVAPGECVNVYWDTDNVQTVYYNNQPVSGITQNRIECPAFSTTYNLLVTTRDNQQILKQVNIQVSDRPVTWNNWDASPVIIDFWADRTQIKAGECLNVYWNTNNVQTVYYNNRPVSGIQQNWVECPSRSTTYNLLVTTRDNRQVLKQIDVQVSGSLSDRGDLDMKAGQMVDFDRKGQVSRDEDDFRWVWTEDERGKFVKANDDHDLRLAVVKEGNSGSFDRLSESDCREWLKRHDSDQVKVEEESIVCIRTDAGDYGKFRVDDIHRSDGRIELDWRIWK